MTEAVVLALITQIGIMAGALIWMVKYLVQKLEPTINKFHKSLDTNTRITDETQKYLKMRNGSLEHLIQDLAEFNRKAVNQQHVQEQVVEHQTINK